MLLWPAANGPRWRRSTNSKTRSPLGLQFIDYCNIRCFAASRFRGKSTSGKT